jgi:uncharacterized protein YcbX
MPPVLTQLNLYPVKSCGGIALREATLTAAGLMSEKIHDREWMVVDAKGEFLTQRDHAQMALIEPRIKMKALELRAPGMLPLEVPLERQHAASTTTLDVRVWNDVVKAVDCGETTAAWFSHFLGRPCRLARFHSDAQRVADTWWTQGREAPVRFADGYPMLVLSEASLADLNAKLKARGRAKLPMNRFRPNIVVSGIDAFEEDYAELFEIGGASLKPVKPCPRCPMPSIDQTTGEFGSDPLDILQTYRANPKIDGGIAFGMNAILMKGEGQVLRVGQEVKVTLAL